MERSEIKGRVHSVQSLGTVDGPGVRFVVFLSGCPLRCKCCHNPDTWDFSGGTLYTAEDIVKKAERYCEYFGESGGITLSGGEPVCQAEYSAEIFRLCKEKGINTAVDTCGYVPRSIFEKILPYVDTFLYDIKAIDPEIHEKCTGRDNSLILSNFDYLCSGFYIGIQI